ncbi:hypothetical protein NX784_22470 [Massilia pinisoli]|uniref:DUF4136 domain-containing protein n=1 Tax=Massilia pinisoli TaxID=1772194 RepID=A0ABT1ZWP2_9BURK|nr:hypothetical protein [Massilia pinisoli]MCS0584360.1 hypothetical protein [Massilia pinisoli]
MKNTLITLALMGTTAISAAQTTNAYQGAKVDPLESSARPLIFPAQIDGEVRHDRIIRKRDITDDQRKSVLKGTEKTPEGYLKIGGSTETIDLPSSFANHPRFLKSQTSRSKPATDDSLKLIGTLKEDDFRTDWQFQYKTFDVTFTVWNYKKAGATITVFEDFLNQTVQGVPAALTLSQAEKSAKVLWKLTWWKDGVSYELYINDLLGRNNKPSMSPKEIISIAQLALDKTKG